MGSERGCGGFVLVLSLLACGRFGYHGVGSGDAGVPPEGGGVGQGGSGPVPTGAGGSGPLDLAPGIPEVGTLDVRPADSGSGDGSSPADGADPDGGDAPAEAAPDGATPAGLLLHWRFDESGGDVALDSGGARLHGQYTGASGIPSASSLVPLVSPGNPRSRSFLRIGRHAVQLAGMPASLKPRRELTVMAWYRASDIDTNGAEVLSAGDHYVLRVKYSSQIELGKRVTGPAGPTWVQCLAAVSDPTDGRWHHIAGVFSARGMEIYFDHQLRCTNPDAREILYDLPTGTDLWVGRHGNRAPGWDFQGHIDDLRIYGRALSAEEIAAPRP